MQLLFCLLWTCFAPENFQLASDNTATKNKNKKKNPTMWRTCMHVLSVCEQLLNVQQNTVNILFLHALPNITVWLLPKAKCSHPRINSINPIWDLLEWRGTGQSRGRLRLGDDAAAVAENAYMLWRTSSWCSPWCGSAGSPGLEGSHYTWDTRAQGYSPDAASQYLKVRDTDHNSSLLDGCSSSTCIFWQTDYTTKVIQSNVLAILNDFCCI